MQNDSTVFAKRSLSGSPCDKRSANEGCTAMNWQVYIILCADQSLYTGITTDPERRIAEHLAGRGARYFRGHRPLRFVYLEGGHDRSSAARREAAIKRLNTAAKRLLITSPDNRLSAVEALAEQASANPHS